MYSPSASDVKAWTAYIRDAAIKRGIDPNVAVRVAQSEGLGQGIWQGQSKLSYGQEQSFGPFQLHDPPKSWKNGAGGLGTKFRELTGLDPRDPANTKAGIDFALDYAAKNGWGEWFGAKNVGIGQHQGIGPNAVALNKYSAEPTIEPQSGYNFAGSGPQSEPVIKQQSGYNFAGSVPEAQSAAASNGNTVSPAVDAPVNQAASQSALSNYQRMVLRQLQAGDPSQAARQMQLSKIDPKTLKSMTANTGPTSLLKNPSFNLGNGLLSKIFGLFGG